MGKVTRRNRGWVADDGQPPGWQNTDLFMAMYPTRAERRAFNARRALYYRHVHEGRATRGRQDLARYMSGQALKEKTT